MGTLIFIGGAKSALPPPPVEVLQYPHIFGVNTSIVYRDGKFAVTCRVSFTLNLI